MVGALLALIHDVFSCFGKVGMFMFYRGFMGGEPESDRGVGSVCVSFQALLCSSIDFCYPPNFSIFFI